MPTLYEIFGISASKRDETSEESRKRCACPFMGGLCDGGGNRNQTKIPLNSNEPLKAYFNADICEVVPGICSISTGESVWVVCPRRLFSARHSGTENPIINQFLQSYERELLLCAGLPSETAIGIWSEVSINRSNEDTEVNYSFDYVVAPLLTKTLDEFEQMGYDRRSVRHSARTGNNIANVRSDPSNEIIHMPDLSNFLILEVMTASTSGSNNRNETDIRSAFRNTLLNGENKSPGINKRQIWGRMVTQMFAKTILAEQWGGKAIWIVQDELLKNIERTTRLDTVKLMNQQPHKVMMGVLYYVGDETDNQQIAFKEIIQGDMGINAAGSHTFTDILLPQTAPPQSDFLLAILRKRLAAVVSL